MNKEREQKIYEVYGVTPGPWEVVNTGAEDGETYLIANAPSMLVKLWDMMEDLGGLYNDLAENVDVVYANEPITNDLENYLSSLHPQSLPFEEILRRIEE